MAVLAPMPKAMVSMAVSTKIGLLRRVRAAKAKSFKVNVAPHRSGQFGKIAPASALLRHLTPNERLRATAAFVGEVVAGHLSSVCRGGRGLRVGRARGRCGLGRRR